MRRIGLTEDIRGFKFGTFNTFLLAHTLSVKMGCAFFSFLNDVKKSANILTNQFECCIFAVELINMVQTNKRLEEMKANVENLVKCLNNLINLYNRNMGYNYEVKHYDEDGQIAVWCNPTNAIISDVTMVARAFLNNASVVNVDFSFGFIEIYYCDTTFKEDADMFLLEMVGAIETEE